MDSIYEFLQTHNYKYYAEKNGFKTIKCLLTQDREAEEDLHKKYVTLKIYDSGKIEYTTNWRENQQITIKTIVVVRDIIIFLR